MKSYISDIIPKIKRYSQELENISLLKNKHWVVIDELMDTKIVFIFRDNSELIISKNGKAERGRWEYLDNNTLLIDRKDDLFLFRHGFLDSTILALKVDGKEEYTFLVNETKYQAELNTIERVRSFLGKKYLSASNPPSPTVVNIEELTKELNPIPNDDNKFGYVNMDGNTVIPFKYDMAYDFHDGMGLVYKTVNGTDLYGFVNEKGEEAVNLKYEYAENFSEGLALVRFSRRFGYINRSGTLVIDFLFDDATSFVNGRAKVRVRDDSFFIDRQGNSI